VRRAFHGINLHLAPQFGAAKLRQWYRKRSQARARRFPHAFAVL